jgi:endonuclease/exonuclease/phosphatase (EEP) superfamily protein YafD
MESLPKRVLMAAVALAALGLAAAWMIAWIPIWPCTLFEHFRVQYVVVGVALLALAAALRMRGFVDAVAVVTLLHGVAISADLTASPQRGADGGVAIRVLVLNVHTESKSFDQVRQLIADEKPDLIGLVEVDQRWLDGVAAAVGGYAKIVQPRGDNFGVALYARGQVSGAVEYLGGDLPSVVADVAIGDARFRVVLTHPMPPVSDVGYRLEERQLEAVGERARELPEPVVVMGDFNTTPWARVFVRLLHRSGLCDSRAGFGAQASFPAMTALVRIPIDHLLASCSIGVRDRRIARDVGSDHLPVVLDLVIPRP